MSQTSKQGRRYLPSPYFFERMMILNDQERILLRYVCEGDIRSAQKQARIVLEGINTQKDQRFKENLLAKLTARPMELLELPVNVRDFLVAEDVSEMDCNRLLIREPEKALIHRLLATRTAAQRLAEMKIRYSPSAVLYGASGCGKTTLARQLAHFSGLPFVYVKFSGLISSALGKTQGNLAKVFDYVKNAPCVLCLDEIDCIGMERGQKDDIGEMNRVVISLMQELDTISNDTIVVGTTNRYDRLDPALVRRFSLKYEVLPLTPDEAHEAAVRFFNSVSVPFTEDLIGNILAPFRDSHVPANKVFEACTQYLIKTVVNEEMKNQEVKF